MMEPAMTGPFGDSAEEAGFASPAPAVEELKAAVLLVEAGADGEGVATDSDDDTGPDVVNDIPAGGDSTELGGESVLVWATIERDDGVDRVAETAIEVERTTT